MSGRSKVRGFGAAIVLIVLGAGIVPVIAGTAGAQTTPSVLNCNVTTYRLLFWPQGHGKVKSQNFPEYTVPHVELYTGSGREVPREPIPGLRRLRRSDQPRADVHRGNVERHQRRRDPRREAEDDHEDDGARVHGAVGVGAHRADPGQGEPERRDHGSIGRVGDDVGAQLAAAVRLVDVQAAEGAEVARFSPGWRPEPRTSSRRRARSGSRGVC